mmetsp:Transcript_9527/g.35657  ORF Transcript_9527/g.35657 Transcript_9527/m.35657 type:complete len:327 (+) Transcript_9527:1584-2564(+)
MGRLLGHARADRQVHVRGRREHGASSLGSRSRGRALRRPEPVSPDRGHCHLHDPEPVQQEVYTRRDPKHLPERLTADQRERGLPRVRQVLARPGQKRRAVDVPGRLQDLARLCAGGHREPAVERVLPHVPAQRAVPSLHCPCPEEVLRDRGRGLEDRGVRIPRRRRVRLRRLPGRRSGPGADVRLRWTFHPGDVQSGPPPVGGPEHQGGHHPGRRRPQPAAGRGGRFRRGGEAGRSFQAQQGRHRRPPDDRELRRTAPQGLHHCRVRRRRLRKAQARGARRHGHGVHEQDDPRLLLLDGAEAGAFDARTLPSGDQCPLRRARSGES